MKNKDVKILWLSDIHFSDKYQPTFGIKADFRNYLIEFVAKVKSEALAGRDECIDYIFLTGDLAQAGTKSDYFLLMDKLLAPLLDVFIDTNLPRPKVIAIPGNHDLNWKKSDFLKDYLAQASGLSGDYEKRSNYLENHLEDFERLFSEYSDFLIDVVKDYKKGKYTDFFTFDEGISLRVSRYYNQHRLFGYILDHKNRLIINLINTAWFSLGGKFNEILAEVSSEDEEWKISNIHVPKGTEPTDVGKLIQENNKKQIWSVLKKKESISEYNNQITGIHLSEHVKLLADIEKYKEYFVITCMHHPLNWLQWDELYTYKETEANKTAFILKKVLGESNVVLTGHEHVPKEVGAEYKSDSTIMLKSGCFLSDNQHNKVSLQNSWFSILSIDPDRGILRHSKIAYDLDKGWFDYTFPFPEKYRVYKQNSAYDLSPERLSEVGELVKKTSAEKFGKAMSRFCKGHPEITSIAELYRNQAFVIYAKQRGSAHELCIFALDHGAYKCFLKDDFSDVLISTIREYPYAISVIRFAILDLFIDSPKIDHMTEFQTAEYSSGDRSEQLQRRVNLADDMFDVFRHRFFNRFERDFAKGKSLEAVFEAIKDCAFINSIIPFWILENIWRTV